jgi:hypothetical protein
MPQPNSNVVPQPPRTPVRADTHDGRVAAPFFGTLDCVMLDDLCEFVFDGAITRASAIAAATWLARDVAPDLTPRDADAAAARAAFSATLPTLVGRAREALVAAKASPEAQRRLRIELGGEVFLERLPTVLTALRCQPALEKAEAFGRALNGISEESKLTATLQAIPMEDPAVASLLIMAAMGQVINPTRLIAAATRIAGDSTDAALVTAGFGPLVEALLAQAQNTLPPLRQAGAFVDIDLACRAIDRFHRISRALTANLVLARPGRWSTILGRLTRTVSERLEPKLRDVIADISFALRQVPGGVDRLDADRLLAALNDVYLLATVRDCRDSLAVNEAFDDTWTRAGQSLELHLTRNLELLRDKPGDRIVAARLDAGIKMAAIRFGPEYADVLRRARHGAEKRPPSA